MIRLLSGLVRYENIIIEEIGANVGLYGDSVSSDGDVDNNSTIINNTNTNMNGNSKIVDNDNHTIKKQI